MMSSKLYSREALVDAWKYFIGAFKDLNEKDSSGYGTYFDRINRMAADNSSRLLLNYQDLATYVEENLGKKENDVSILLDLILEDPDEARETLKDAVASVLMDINSSYLAEIKHILRADFTNFPIVKEVPDLNMDAVSKPCQLDGIVMEADERARVKITSFYWECEDGHLTPTDNDKKPVRCAGGERDDEGKRERCYSQIFREMQQLHTKVDYIELKVQQRLDRIDEKKTTVDIDMTVSGRDLVNFVVKQLHLADYIAVNGIIRLRKSNVKAIDSASVADLYMDASDIEIKPESTLTEFDPAYAELVKYAVTPENEEADYEKLLRSVCPSVYSEPNDPIKEAMLLLLVGADERKNRDGTRLRGEIQMLLLGDKGGAKSTLIKWLVLCAPRGMYTSGSKTSAVSLVGGMKPSEDPNRPARLTIGIFGIADLVALDELEKRKEEEINSLAEPMQDSQSIHIGKAGQRREQEISVRVVAAANPTDKLAKYDITKDIFTNTKLPAWLLDRFDVIFIMRDVPNKRRDEAIFSHIISTRKQSRTRQQFDAGKHDFKRLNDDYYPIGYLKQWVMHVRETYHPSVVESPEALDAIHKFFNEYRKFNIRQPRTQEEKDNWSKDYEMPAVQWRTLQSLLRFAEARARACHRNYVTVEDAERAINIVRTSIASSGMSNFTEIKMIDEEITDIQSKVDELADRAAMKKRFRDMNHDAKQFSVGLAHLSWERCMECNGDGFKSDVGEGGKEDRIICDICEMAGGQRKPFDYSELKQYCLNRKVYNKAFELMWKRCLVEKQIVPVKGMPGLYENKRSDNAVLDFSEHARRDPSRFEKADSLFIKHQQVRNAELKKYIDDLDVTEDYDQS